MRLSLDQISPLFLISTAAFFVSLSFEIGYFREIWIEFISYLSPEKIFISFAFMFPILISTWWIFRWIIRKIITSDFRIFALLRRWKFTSSISDKISRVLLFTANLKPKLIGFFAFMAIFLLLLSPVLILFWFIGPKYTSSLIIYSLIVFSITFISSGILRDIIEYDDVNFSDFFMLFVMSCVLSNSIGHDYSRHIAGQSCLIKTQSSDFEAIFLRSVENGILLRIEDSISYLSNNELKQIICQEESEL